ncbi:MULTISPECIES: hypothetical protein [unclassified Methylobacterium]|jgi:hypothetical protein|uniref:hypothetical protein n=1 Tax=unclassified Methylobacterium TaxID=2615210 RepID=UPI00135607F4|nr:hypothetical protein [Methylobacterium sp. 2A]MWV22708.1 hypothetical protein [Methylobacterium sp. 2A]
MSASFQDAPAHQEEGSAVINLNEAVERAKAWLHATMSGESITNVGLEEVEHQPGYWNITLGFSRPWDATRNAVTVLSGAVVMRRTFKTITVDERTGEVVAMKNRTPEM